MSGTTKSPKAAESEPEDVAEPVDPDGAVDPDTAPEGRTPARGRTARAARALRARRTAVAWAAALTVALLLAGYSAWSYVDTRGDGALSYGKARDAALAAGTRGVARLNTVDAAHVARDLDDWLGVTTGPLHAQLTRTHASDTATMKAAATSTRGTVTDAAVTELDTRAGTAQLIVTVQVRLTPAAGTATTDRKRFEANLSRTDGTWKLAALTAVPIGAS
ncbi:hypothetical protein [Actinacidiphila sp. bgisy145]|uniref:hypothetical protein n=1 Tax=Actinacidiphila sp. bgisy145 TaxID=3413792 RepID=UPI003EBF2D8C